AAAATMAMPAAATAARRRRIIGESLSRCGAALNVKHLRSNADVPTMAVVDKPSVAGAYCAGNETENAVGCFPAGIRPEQLKARRRGVDASATNAGATARRERSRGMACCIALLALTVAVPLGLAAFAEAQPSPPGSPPTAASAVQRIAIVLAREQRDRLPPLS